jgi:hypothetical protein
MPLVKLKGQIRNPTASEAYFTICCYLIDGLLVEAINRAADFSVEVAFKQSSTCDCKGNN